MSPKIFTMKTCKHKTLCDFNLSIIESDDEIKFDIFVNDDYLFTVSNMRFEGLRFENFSLGDIRRIEGLDVTLAEICALLYFIDSYGLEMSSQEFRDSTHDFHYFTDCVTYIRKLKPDFFNI